MSRTPIRSRYSTFSQKAPAGLNVSNYTSADADCLLELARVEFDPARRAALYHQLHALLARSTISVDGAGLLVNRRVQGVHASHGVGLFHHYPGFAWRGE